MICPKCKGGGSLNYILRINNKPQSIIGYCYFCHGKKELDWIEYALGQPSSDSGWGDIILYNRHISNEGEYNE